MVYLFPFIYIVYQMCDQNTKALNAYRVASAWREVFSLAKQLQYSTEDIQGLAYDVIGTGEKLLAYY